MKKIFPKAEHGIVNRATGTIFKNHGWPSVCRDDRGVLYAVASGMRISHCDPAGKNCMYVSFNEGKTWTKPIVVNDDYLDDRDMGIVSLGGGRMVISFFNQRDWDDYKRFAGYEWMKPEDKAMVLNMGAVVPLLSEEKQKDGSYVMLSDDYGVTWSDPIEVPVSAPHGPNVLSDGSLLYLGRVGGGYENACRIAAYKSTDFGKTWEYTGLVPMPNPEIFTTDFLHEPHVVELPNGRLLGAIRVHCRPAPMTPTDTCYTTFSDDGGKTWSVPQSVDCEGLPPHLMVHSSGAVILSYAKRGGEGDSSERACVSYDGGETWAEEYIFYPDAIHYDLGYPCTTELSDGSLLSVYYQCWPGDEHCSVMQTKWRLGEEQ